MVDDVIASVLLTFNCSWQFNNNLTTWADYARKSCVIIDPIHEVIFGLFSCVIILIIAQNYVLTSQR